MHRLGSYICIHIASFHVCYLHFVFLWGRYSPHGFVIPIGIVILYLCENGIHSSSGFMYSHWYCYSVFEYVSICVITVFVIWIRVFVCPPIAMLPRARLTRLAADADATIWDRWGNIYKMKLFLQWRYQVLSRINNFFSLNTKSSQKQIEKTCALLLEGDMKMHL